MCQPIKPKQIIHKFLERNLVQLFDEIEFATNVTGFTFHLSYSCVVMEDNYTDRSGDGRAQGYQI